MLSVGWLVVAVVLAVLLTTWIAFTATRLDRLHARCDAAQAALDAQLVRRAAALAHVAESSDSGVPDDRRPHYDGIARTALDPDRAWSEHARHEAENAVGRAVIELAGPAIELRPDAAEELLEAAARVLISRRFYNDAVRDTRALRARRLPRMFRMAGRRAMPEFFDIDDRLPVRPGSGSADRPVDPGRDPVTTRPTPTEEDLA